MLFRKNFKPWMMVLVLMGFLFFMMPGMNSTVNLFVVPVSTELNITRSAYSITFLACSAAMVISSFFYGKIYKRIGARWILFLSGFFALAGCLLSANAYSIGLLYVGAFFRGLALAFGSTAIIANVINNWFFKHQGLVMGIAFSAVGFGGALLMPVFTSMVFNETVGWRMTYYFIGGIVFVASIVAALLIRSTPEEAKAVPFGITQAKSETQNNNSVDIPLWDAVKTPAFAITIIIIFALNITLYSTYAHLEAYLQQYTLKIETVSAALALLALGVGGGKLFYGTLCDKFGMRITAMAASLFCVSSLLLLLLGRSDALVITGCILLGIGIGSLQLLVSLFAGIFGRNNYSLIVGIFSAELGLAWGIGPWLSGVYFDAMGNYTGLITLFIILGVVCLLLSFKLPKRSVIIGIS